MHLTGRYGGGYTRNLLGKFTQVMFGTRAITETEAEILKRKIERLRGEPIFVFSGDPLTIPCHEESNTERLCKHPVVSVHMLAYNHERWIRQAIEGVMMQQTDFEFELVIGEDCSTDRTREICRAYQKRYPDKIRLLWSEENLYRHPHPAGANSRRIFAHCRGEYHAFCEGDDFWTRPDKLQLQVNAFRANPAATVCYTDFSLLHWQSGILEEHVVHASGLWEQLKTFTRKDWLHERQNEWLTTSMATSTMMLRGDCVRTFLESDFAHKKLCFGDITLQMMGARAGEVIVLPQDCSTYRMGVGVTQAMFREGRILMQCDSMLVKLEYEYPSLTDAEKKDFVYTSIFPALKDGVKHPFYTMKTYCRLCALVCWTFRFIPSWKIPSTLWRIMKGFIKEVKVLAKRQVARR